VTLTVAAHLLNVVKMELWTATASWASTYRVLKAKRRQCGGEERLSVVVMSLSQALGWLAFFGGFVFFDKVDDSGIALVLVVLGHLDLVLLKRVAVGCFPLL
jgi:hypothetical protein